MTNSNIEADPSALTLERYALVLAHIRFFGVGSTDEILRRLQIAPPRWASDSAAWKSAMAAEIEAGDKATPLALRFASSYRQSLQQLQSKKPSIDSIGPAPVENEPATVAMPAARVARIEDLPEREPVKPAYVLETKMAAEAPIPVSEARTSLEVSTLPSSDEPAAPSTPFTSAEPDESGFSLPHYARLCAELVRSSDRNAVLAHHGLDVIKQTELDTHWRARIRGDRKIATAFERAYNHQLLELNRRDSGASAAARSAGPVTLPVGFQQAKPPVAPPSPAVPPSPRVPLAPSTPKLSLDRHAALCAEIAMGVDLPENLLAKWSLSPAEKEADDAYYRSKVKDQNINQIWHTAFETARKQILSRSGRVQ